MKSIAGVVLAALLCACLGGCTRIQEVALSVPDKVNAAYPVDVEVRAAQERLSRLLVDPAEAAALKTQVDARMTARAVTCAKDSSIGRFSSVAAVRALALDAACFKDQDRALKSFYGARTVGHLLMQPSLRAFKPVGDAASLAPGRLSAIVTATVARDANVAVVRDPVGDAAVVELPSGKPIAELPRASIGEPDSHVSPNGRVFSAVTLYGNESVFYDMASGERLWEVPGVRTLSWLPELGSLIVVGRDGVVMLVDGVNGTVAPHPVAERGSSFAAVIPGGEARRLVGSSRTLALIEHTRGATGLQATAVRKYRLDSVNGITSGNPVSMLSGARVVFASSRDVGWLDLASGEGGTWKLAPNFGAAFAKLDESHLQIDSYEGQLGRKSWSFDIAAETVAPVEGWNQPGMLMGIGDRVGFMRRSNGAVFGDRAATGAALPLAQVTADLELQRQLAALPPQPQQQQAAALSAPKPLMSAIPADSQLYVVGVYEGERSTSKEPSGTGHPKRNVRVVVRKSSRPLVLVFSSYEPVNWVVMNTGAHIAAVLVSGYYPSTVTGLGDVTVQPIGSAYAYAPDGREYQQLKDAVTRFVGPLPIRSFRGTYSGHDFTVGDGS